jgi:uncharacterized repeat protein (TIGR03803 family)
MNTIEQRKQIRYSGRLNTSPSGGCWRRVGLLGLFLAAAIAAPAQTFTTLVNFDNTNGAGPVALTLVQGTDGNLYGTTQGGGTNNLGTAFKMTAAGLLTSLHSFTGSDGQTLVNGLVLGRDGNFYGIAEFGGSGGAGTVFKMTPDGTVNTLHIFVTTDGKYPLGPLVEGADGVFYGGTGQGGANGQGTIFKITSGGAFTSLHDFAGTEGSGISGGLVRGNDGNFYGVSFFGGTNGAGAAFEVTPAGTLTPLASFGGIYGGNPGGGLVLGSNGNFYGTTEGGGAHNGTGTVFKMTPSGALTVLHTFHTADGFQPNAPLIQATDGNFYGTTVSGGANGAGDIYQITPQGVLTIEHSFTSSEGSTFGDLFEATNGILYGPTYLGGTQKMGSIFSLSVGLGPFVETLPTSGEIGANVKILGNNLTSATAVNFNGTPAVFTVDSKSLITTTVPAGATSGFVTVTTPTKTLKSNVKFRVRP